MVINLKKILFPLKNYIRELTLGPLFKLLEAIIEIMLPFIIANIIDNVFYYNISQIICRGLFLIFLAFIGITFATISQYFAAKASQGYGTSLRYIVFEHIFNLSNLQIQKFNPTTLTNRIINDINNLEIGVAMFIRLVIRVPFICIGSIVMTFIINKKIALILLITTIIFSVILYVIIRISAPLYKKVAKSLDKLTLIVRENLVNMKIIRSFSTYEKEKSKFNMSNNSTYYLAKISSTISGMVRSNNHSNIEFNYMCDIRFNKFKILSFIY